MWPQPDIAAANRRTPVEKRDNKIAAAPNPRDRGALHLELALIFQEKLDDDAQAQVNFEQALAFDPSIPAARAPLARRYESIFAHQYVAE